jgi:energy-coupling factor transporter ATP-binding protein EcfA2
MSEELWPFPGSRWWKFDFHCHTPASSDYGAGPNQAALKGRTCREWISDFLSAGIHCVAVTDHNCGDWVDPLKAELAKMRIEGVSGADQFHLFPGVELTVNGAHFLAIFDPSATTQAIRDLLAVCRYNNAEKNAEGYCGESVTNICEEVLSRKGLFIPAHVDLAATGMFKLQANLSAIDPILKLEGVLAMEVCDGAYAPPACYAAAKLRWVRVLGSDSHHPSAPPLGSAISSPSYPGSHFTWVKMATPSIGALRLALIDGEGVSIRRSDEAGPFDPFRVPEDVIEQIEIADARYMGRGNAEVIKFSPWLNALIGGRGSGKSTVLQLLRLGLRREGELSKLPSESSPRKEFERFNKRAQGRTEEGALTPGTNVRLIYRHQGGRYRVGWPESASSPSVEEWDAAANEWKRAASQEIRERFPLRIFSQGQIAVLAGEQSGALLRLVDEAVNYTGWKERWEERERNFFGLRNKVRELDSRLNSRDRVVGQLEDAQRKLAKFEEAEHARVLKDYQARSRQQKEHLQQANEARETGERLVALAEEIVASDVPEGVFAPEDTLGAEALASIERMRNSIRAAAAAVQKAGEDLRATADAETRSVESSGWHTEITSVKAAYDNLVEELREQGVQDPSEYGRLVQERQRLEGEVKALEALAETQQQRRTECDQALADLLTIRRELSALREQFLSSALSNNEYVRIELQRYGREPHAARDSLREMLGVDGNPGQFEQDIFLRDETGTSPDQGMIASLLADLPATNPVAEIERRLGGIRDGLVSVATGGEFSEIGGHLRNRLRKNAENRPEFADRILTWFPEDTLAVSYSPKGDGTDFRPIQQGSAGQRAAAMLAFLLAQGHEPIVVDQPEDDLDNHLIYRLVVQQMRSNKQRRQIIAVTHNPNIVVNGDAEMVHALDFKTGQCRVTEKGSLQDAPIRSEICRVMEGGEEAFEQRYRRIGKGGRHV